MLTPVFPSRFGWCGGHTAGGQLTSRRYHTPGRPRQPTAVPVRFPSACALVLALLMLAPARAGDAANPGVRGPAQVGTALTISPRRDPAEPHAIARESSDEGALPAVGRRGFWWNAASLCVVVALILLTARFFRRRMPATPTALPAEAVHVLGRTPLDPKQSIYLVRCGSRLLVLGSGGSGLNTLAEIVGAEEVDHLAGLCRQARQRSASQTFANLLRRHRQSGPSEDRHPVEHGFDTEDIRMAEQANHLLERADG